MNTVDGFQGREVDVVVISCVRSQKFNGSIGFLSDTRRMNVAITRAKDSLVICGSLKSLEVSNILPHIAFSLILDIMYRITCL